MTKADSSGPNPDGAADEITGARKGGDAAPASDPVPSSAAAPAVAAENLGAGSAPTIDEVRAALEPLLARFGITSAVIVDDEAYDVAFSDVYALVSIHTEAAREA